jgi:hypothetical protein
VLDGAGFFEESALIGSWVMPLYQEVFGINYALRTMDIDFAIKFAANEKGRKADIENILTDLGYVPVMLQSGVCKYTRENFTIEFIVHRKGGRDDRTVKIKEMEYYRCSSSLCRHSAQIHFYRRLWKFQDKSACPGDLFCSKNACAQRRPEDSKRHKDLEQCSIISASIDPGRLQIIVETLKLSIKNRKALLASCEEIDFPPQKLGLS